LRFCNGHFTIVLLCWVFRRLGRLHLASFDLGSTGLESVPLGILQLDQLVLVILLADILDVEVAEFAHCHRLRDLARLVLPIVLGPVTLQLGHLVDLSKCSEFHTLEDVFAGELGLLGVVGFLERQLELLFVQALNGAQLLQAFLEG